MNFSKNKIFRLLTVAVLLISVFGLVGWFTENLLFARFSVLYIPIAPSTAVSFIALGIAALLVSYSGKYRVKTLAALLTALVLIQCLIILAEGIFFPGLKIGLEKIYLESPGDFRENVPMGRMSPLTSILFLLIGTTIFLHLVKKPENKKNKNHILHFPAMIAQTISIILLIGYLYKAPLLYGSSIIPVALPTSVNFFLLGFATLLLVRFDYWNFLRLKNSNPGRQLSRVFIPFVLIIIVLIGYIDSVFVVSSQHPTLTSAILLIVSFPVTVFLVVSVSKKISRVLTKKEEALQESQRALSNLISNMPGLVYRCRNDKNWTMEFLNQKTVWLTGYQPEELLGNKIISYNELIHPDDREKIWEAIQVAVKKRENFELIYRIKTRSGQEKWVTEKGKAVYSDSGLPLFLEGIILDVTDKKNAEQELEDYRLHLEKLVKERTHELEERNRDLEKMNDLFVGREFRIKELKDKINELKQSLKNNDL